MFPSSLISTSAPRERSAVSLKEKGGTYGVQVGTVAPKEIAVTSAASPEAIQWDGYGTALKPAFEPIALARKPLAGTVVENVLEYGTGAIAIDACRIEGVKDVPASAPKDRTNLAKGAEKNRTMDTSGFDPNIGRWPANLILDSEAARYLDEQAGERPSRKSVTRNGGGGKIFNGEGSYKVGTPDGGYEDSGGPSRFYARADYDEAEVRFYYSAKVSTKEREAGCESLVAKSAGEMTEREDDTAGLECPRAGAGRTGGAKNHHPTLKPLALNKYIARLIRPATDSSMLLVPWCGAGSEIIGALMAGWHNVLGIEREKDYCEIATTRINHHIGR
jgi:hypothetical protein